MVTMSLPKFEPTAADWQESQHNMFTPLFQYTSLLDGHPRGYWGLVLGSVVSKRRVQLSVTAAIILIVTAYYMCIGHPGYNDATSDVMEVMNRTLGFQNIYVLSLPGRMDKRDTWALASTATGFDFTYVDGVKPEDIPAKGIPGGWDQRLGKGGTLACYRGHMNALQKIVEEQVQSAFIFEDDADWDITLKQQLVEFARGARYIQEGAIPEPGFSSPYGDSWDLFWFGHCGTQSKSTQDSRYWVIDDDPTVTALSRRRLNPGRLIDTSATELQGNFTRIIHEEWNARCTTAYAVSLQGARKILHHFSLEPHAGPSDRMLATFCDGDIVPNKLCLTSTPSLVDPYMPAGDVGRDSDRRGGMHGELRAKAVTEYLVFPAKSGMSAWVDRRPHENIWNSQWPNETMVERIDLDSFQYPRGRGVFLEASKFHPPNGV